jgi:hypothetical protein
MPTVNKAILMAAAITLASINLAQAELQKHHRATIVGDVYDASCFFTQDITKPISHECAVTCSKAGSPLVIVVADGTIYLPVDPVVPSKGQNFQLEKFGGMKVKVTGEVYERSHEKGIAIEKVELAK